MILCPGGLFSCGAKRSIASRRYRSNWRLLGMFFWPKVGKVYENGGFFGLAPICPVDHADTVQAL